MGKRGLRLRRLRLSAPLEYGELKGVSMDGSCRTCLKSKASNYSGKLFSCLQNKTFKIERIANSYIETSTGKIIVIRQCPDYVEEES